MNFEAILKQGASSMGCAGIKEEQSIRKSYLELIADKLTI